jgi:hypothetical protein
MIMKKNICLMLVVAATVCVRAQDTREWNALLKVVDDAGQPVSGADVSIFYDVPPQLESTDSGKITGLTDTNGLFAASHHDQTYGLRFLVRKTGYYSDDLYKDFHGVFTPGNLNPNLTLLLKKIGHPIAMYAKKEETKMPRENEPIGFDLTVGDWVAPYGTGKTADMFFTVHRKITSPQEFDADLELTFPNAGDGIIIVPPAPDTGSPLVMPRPAPEDGYQSERTWRYHNLTEQPEGVLGYFFRVRTVLDSNGNVKSALYGKIQGDVRFFVGTRAPRAGIAFQYYLNPTPNDRNIEFDPKQNLLGGLPFDAQVTAP